MFCQARKRTVNNAEDVWRASAPWSCLARKRAVIMSDAQAHRDHAGAQAHRDHVGAQTHRDHAEDVWRASAPEDALLSTYPEGGVGLGMGGRGSVRPTFTTSSS